MLISVFRHPKDNQPSCGEAPWEALSQTLASPLTTECTLETCERNTCPHKKNGMLWSPAFYPAGKTRNAVNVEGVSLLVVDIDHVPPAELGNILGRIWHLKHVVHASHSDRPSDRCVRAVIATSRVVKPGEWKKFWRAALHVYGLPGDTSTVDPCRMYFTPSRPKDAVTDAIDGSGYLFYSQDGALLDVDAVLAQALPEPVAEPGDFDGADFEIPDFHGAPPVEQLEAAVEALGRAWPSRRRNDAHLALMGGLARAGWPAELIANFCAGVAEIQQRGNGDLPKRFRDANATVDKLLSGTNVVGWTRLRSILDDQGMPGEEAILHARRALGFPDPVPTPDPGFVETMNALGAKSPSSFLVQFDSVSREYAPDVTLTVAPTPDQILAALESARDKLKRHASESDKYASRLLARILKNDIFPDEDEFRRAVVVVATTVPAGATAANVQAIVSACASGAYITRLEEIAQDAMKIADQVRAARNTFSAIDKNGVPKPDSADNIRTALDLSDVRLSYDAFADREMIQEGDEPCVPIEDHHVYRLADTWERKHGFVIKSTSKLHNTISVIAREHTYHPVLDYLGALPPVASEDVNLPQEWLIRFAGAKDTPYVRAVSQLMLVAAVRRVRRPGAKFDEMLVLEGDQGSSKSRALRHLVPNEDLFTDAIKLGMEAKEVMEIVVGRWVVEIPEMHKTGADSLVKGMLSKQEDSARMSYGRRRHTQRRHFVIVGTTNEKQYLTDRTGNRRYWPIAVGEVDVDGLVEARDRIWAAAVAVEAADLSEACIRLPKELWPVAAEEQEQRRQKSSTELSLVGALTPYGTDEYAGVQVRIRAEDVRHIALGGGSPHRADHIEIRDVMQKLGWNFIESARWPGTKRFGGVWRRGDEGQASKIYLEVETDQRGAFSDLRERVVDKAVKAPVFSGVN